MDMKVNGVQLPDNKTGFTMDELKSMSKQQLLTIFDANNSGTISDKELNAKGLDGDELLEIKAHLGTVEIETEVRQTKTGFSMEQLGTMTKQQLLTIFDANNSGTISGQELKLKGLDGDEIAEIKAHVSSLEIEEKKEVEQNEKTAQTQQKPVRNTKEIGNVTFYEDEVRYVETGTFMFDDTKSKHWYKVKTPFGSFEFYDHENENKKGSIKGGHFRNVNIQSYDGNEKANNIYFQDNSSVKMGLSNLVNGKKDVIRVYHDSDIGYITNDDLDAYDEIWYYDEKGNRQIKSGNEFPDNPWKKH